jgi:hypothetical protein
VSKKTSASKILEFAETVTLIAISSVSSLVAVASLDFKITIIDHQSLEVVYTIELEERVDELTVHFCFFKRPLTKKSKLISPRILDSIARQISF